MFYYANYLTKKIIIIMFFISQIVHYIDLIGIFAV